MKSKVIGLVVMVFGILFAGFLAAIGFGVSISPPEEFQAQIKSEMARWAKVIRDADIKRIE